MNKTNENKLSNFIVNAIILKDNGFENENIIVIHDFQDGDLILYFYFNNYFDPKRKISFLDLNLTKANVKEVSQMIIENGFEIEIVEY